MNWYEPILERGLVPDRLIRIAIRRLLADRLAEEGRGGDAEVQTRLSGFIGQLNFSPVALHTAKANQQHYEVPAAFFQRVLGPNLKYSSCCFPTGTETLAEAEVAMLDLTVERARLEDGQAILELGCGWGSLSLYMADRYPNSRITAVSNSGSQREFILRQANQRGLRNLEVITCDMNHFDPGATFDRVVSVEMFEHMRNFEELLRRISTWLKPAGLLFVHIFAHQKYAYPFEVRGSGDWMAEHFFTGGIMPSAALLTRFRRHMIAITQWTLNGRHYQKTSEEWLLLTDANRTEILSLFSDVYGKKNALRWLVRWRVFFMACAELFGYNNGDEWIVAHYLFKKVGTVG